MERWQGGNLLWSEGSGGASQRDTAASGRGQQGPRPWRRKVPGRGQGRAMGRCGWSSHLTMGQRTGGRADAVACKGGGEEAVQQAGQKTATQVRRRRRLWEPSKVQTARGLVTDEVWGPRERETSGGPCASDV